MSKDIVERLRKRERLFADDVPMWDQAADEIERLRILAHCLIDLAADGSVTGWDRWRKKIHKILEDQ